MNWNRLLKPSTNCTKCNLKQTEIIEGVCRNCREWDNGNITPPPQEVMDAYDNKEFISVKIEMLIADTKESMKSNPELEELLTHYISLSKLSCKRCGFKQTAVDYIFGLKITGYHVRCLNCDLTNCFLNPIPEDSKANAPGVMRYISEKFGGIEIVIRSLNNLDETIRFSGQQCVEILNPYEDRVYVCDPIALQTIKSWHSPVALEYLDHEKDTKEAMLALVENDHLVLLNEETIDPSNWTQCDSENSLWNQRVNRRYYKLLEWDINTDPDTIWERAAKEIYDQEIRPLLSYRGGCNESPE